MNRSTIRRPRLLLAAILGVILTTALPVAASTDCLLAETNRVRNAASLPSLESDGRLAAAAARHASAMAAADRVFHSRDLAASAPAGWTSLAENVGAGPDCESIAAAFFGSTPHRANLLGDFVAIGIGAAAGSDGTIYVTQIFMSAGPTLPVQLPASPIAETPPPLESTSPLQPLPEPPIRDTIPAVPGAKTSRLGYFEIAPAPATRGWLEPAGDVAFIAHPWGFLIV